jgi:hypothetical protein
MTLAHIGIGKAISWAIGLAVAFLFAMDPTWKMFVVGALIASIPPTITGIFALRLQAANKVALGRVETKVDGNTDELRKRLNQKTDELAGSQMAAAHLEGAQQERVEARERHKDDK